jgi:ABC-2 type transport system ATP-binding protein
VTTALPPRPATDAAVDARPTGHAAGSAAVDARPTGHAAGSAAGGARAHGDGVGITVSHVGKRYAVARSLGEALRAPLARRWVTSLDDVSFDVRPGEFFGLLGPNGAGKTTLFKMLSTLVLPDTGAASVGGHDVRHDGAAVRRLLAPVIADERSLQWRLSAYENLELFAGLHGLARREGASRAREVLHVVGLADTGSRQAGTFSSGMRQRLLVARALLCRPRVLLLDEPTRSLDPMAARELRAFLRDEISGRSGCTVLLATHTAEEVLELCHRVGVLHRGRLMAIGPVSTIAAAVAGQRVALWTTTPRHEAFAQLAARGLATQATASEGLREGEWRRVELEVAGGHAELAEVAGALALAGVAVSRFELVTLPLADLIERVVAREAR